MSYKRHPTRLRDFGAFASDISTLATLRMTIVKRAEVMAETALEEKQPIPFVRKKKKWVNITVRVLLTLLLFALLFKSVSWSLLMASLAHMHHGMLLVGLVVGSCGIVLSAYQWRSLLHAERITTDLANLVNLYIVGIAFSHFLPTGMGGDAVKVLYVGRSSGNSAGSASAAVMCRVTGFFGMLLIALPTLLIWHSHFNANLVISFVLLAVLVAGMIGGAVFAVIWLPRLLKRRWMKHRILSSVLKVGSALSKTAKVPRILLIASLYGIVFWIVAVLNCYCYAEALRLDVPLYFYFFVIPLISLVSFLPISINGFGLRESAFVYAFATVHVPSAPALLLALLMDVQALFFAVVGGFVYLSLSEKAKDAQATRAA